MMKDESPARTYLWKRLLIQYFVWVGICWFLLSFQAIHREGQSIREILHRWVWVPVGQRIASIEKTWVGFQRQLASRRKLIEENRKYREELEYYRHLAVLYRQLLNEVERTKELQNRPWLYSFRVIRARVLVHRVGEIVTHEMLIDRGRRHGVRRFAPVVGQQGMVGFVFSLGDRDAVVRLITHPFFSAGAEVENLPYQAMIRGSGEERKLVLRYLPHGVELAPGTLVLTSGLEGIFPAHLPIGRIKSTVPSPEGDILYTVTPLESLEDLHWVAVLVTGEQE